MSTLPFRFYFFSALLLLGPLGLTGCGSNSSVVERRQVADADMVAKSYKAADALIEQAGGRIDKNKVIVAASFANIDNLNESSSFGRIVSQQLSSRFTQKGYRISEMLLRNNIYIKEREGEFLLSRTLKNISAKHDAQAVIVGTYAVASTSVYVTAKLVRTNDGMVLSSTDYTLPTGPDMRQLVRRQR